MRKRTKARELAMQLLYVAETRGSDDVDVDFFLTEHSGDEDCKAYARELYAGALLARETSDEAIGRCAENWELRRMARVDRNILRLAVHELRHGEVPHKVVINEAVELARRFGTEKSSAFVNGILDRIHREECRAP